MRQLLILSLFVQFFTSYCFGFKNENKIFADTTQCEDIISLKLGYFPQSGKIIGSAGIVVSFSTNSDFQNFLDFGYYFSIYKGIKNSPEKSGLIVGGFNCGHKIYFGNKPLIIRLITGLAVPNYPALTNILEIDFPLILLKHSSLNISFTGGIVGFKELLPYSISIGLTF